MRELTGPAAGFSPFASGVGEITCLLLSAETIKGDLRPASSLNDTPGEVGGVFAGEPADSLKFVEEFLAHAPIVRNNFPLPVSDIYK